MSLLASKKKAALQKNKNPALSKDGQFNQSRDLRVCSRLRAANVLCKAAKTRQDILNSKTEIKISHLPQFLGRKRIKKISPDRCGYRLDWFLALFGGMETGSTGVTVSR